MGGAVRDTVRGALGPTLREGRVSKVRGTVLEVAVRSLLGDAKTLPAVGYAPRTQEVGDGVGILHPVQGDRVWVTTDEGDALVVVAWEPVGA